MPLEFGQDQIKAHLMELELVLSRIDSGRSYYQILGVDQADSTEEIKSSYQQLIEVLYPSPALGDSSPADLVSQIGRAFTKASQAFGVLASHTNRKEYDSALSAVRSPAGAAPKKPKSVDVAPERGRSERTTTAPLQGAVSGPATLPEIRPPNVGTSRSAGQAYSESYATVNDNRRRCGRLKLSIPVRVTGYDHTKGKWHEMTDTIDVSRTGARLRLHRRVKAGTVLFLTLPMPTKLRAHGIAEQSYNVYALLRTVDPSKNGERAVGVEFLGEHPPTGFIEKPWAVYRARRKGANERRRHRRVERAEAIVLEYLDEKGSLIITEEAQSENIGRHGLRIAGTAAPPEFDLVRINCTRVNFTATATLRDRYRGKDGLERLCLQLIEKEWPREITN